MKSSKTTRRALLGSLTSLLLCFAMLIGSTFAWFTDSASTSINKIQSGNLDIEVYHKVGTDASGADQWEKIDGATNLFDNVNGEPILWEPGAVATETFKIVNEGSLALKFEFWLNYANATKTSAGKSLADALTYEFEGFVNTDPNSDNHLEDAMFENYLMPDAAQELTVNIAWEPTANDNDFNVEGGLSIDLGINVLATQYTKEYDSTGNQYDADATYPIISVSAGATAGEINTAIDNALASGSDKLTLNVTASSTATAAAPSAVALNAASLAKVKNLTVNLGENVVLTSEDHSRGEDDIRERYIVPNGQTLKITGKGTIGSTDYLGATGGATLVIENEGGFEQNSVGNAAINIAAHGANVIIRNYTMGNTYSVHPLIIVGDGVSADNGSTEPSKLTLENVTMTNFFFDESRPGAPRADGGVGIQVWRGDIDITTSNVTFNGSTTLNTVKASYARADKAFLAINTDNACNVTLNGVNQ